MHAQRSASHRAEQKKLLACDVIDAGAQRPARERVVTRANPYRH
jgi:hypothetical protein